VLVSNGLIWCTTFAVCLPFVDQVVYSESIVSEKTPAAPLRILAVDDSEPVLAMLQAGLQKLGHKVFTAESGEKGLEIYQSTHIDLIICDLGMPGFNGWKVAQTVKRLCHKRGNSKTPFIVLTGWEDQDQEKDKISESGVDAVLQKPVEMADLVDYIKHMLK
jgi:two-component system, OmpR family, response regulator